MSESSDISSDEYVSSEEGFESSDELSSDNISEISDDEPKELEGEGGWHYVPNVFDDSQPQPRPPFEDNYSSVNPALGDALFLTPGDAFKYFFDSSVINALCSLSNERAALFFQEHPEKLGKINGLKWKEVTKDDTVIKITRSAAI